MTKESGSSVRSLGRGARLQANKIDTPRRYPGHTHFWERALSRRKFMQASGAAAGALLLGSQGWMPASASVPGATPKAIPGGFTAGFCGLPDTEIFHNFAPNVFDPPNTDRSGIFDFNGHIGYAIIDGTGTGHNTATNTNTPLLFEVDLRFMQGEYVGVDGRHRHATFCLI
jgi:hypothetical protein